MGKRWRTHVCHETGETRTCARPGCKVTWAVTCHNGRKHECESCRRGQRRAADRDYQRARRFSKRCDQEDVAAFFETFGLTLQEARQSAQALYDKGLSYQQAKERFRWFMDDRLDFELAEDELAEELAAAGLAVRPVSPMTLAQWEELEADL